MKKIILGLALLFSFSLSYGQSTTPREGLTNGAVKKYTPTILTQNLTDGTLTTDTVLISPGAHENYYYINSGDTLKGCVCIAVLDTTVNGRVKKFTDDNCKRWDKMRIGYATTGLKQDTIKFYGNIECDSSGSGSNKILNIKKDTTKKSYFVDFIFDGTKWVQITPNNQGNGGSMPTNR